MIRGLGLVALLLLLPLLGSPAPAPAGGTPGRWNGWITDENCGAKGANAAHRACAEKCLERGSKLVLYNLADRRLYKLDKQELAKEHIGHEVIVTGTCDGDKIAVDSITMAVV